jgi:hypothetical protein
MAENSGAGHNGAGSGGDCWVRPNGVATPKGGLPAGNGRVFIFSWLSTHLPGVCSWACPSLFLACTQLCSHTGVYHAMVPWYYYFHVRERVRGVVRGVWCVVCGVWCVVCGVRCVVCPTRGGGGDKPRVRVRPTMVEKIPF